MSYRIIIPFIALAFCLSACAKNYDCVCTNPGGSQTVASYHATKQKATSQCKRYYQDHYGNVAWSETSCGIK
jgi:hypothetical protein